MDNVIIITKGVHSIYVYNHKLFIGGPGLSLAFNVDIANGRFRLLKMFTRLCAIVEISTIVIILWLILLIRRL